MDVEIGLSSELLAANQRLTEFRQQLQNNGKIGQSQRCPAAKPLATSAPFTGQSCAKAVCLPTDSGSPQTGASVAVPAHLGWESAGVTAVLRRRQEGVSSAQWAATNDQGAVPCSLPASHASPPPSAVKLYPDIGLAMLRRELTAPGRLWLLLRLLDREGEGRLRIVVMEEAITNPDSPHRLCGQRQLRNLLKAGEGLFWTRDREWLWLRSAAKVAYGLGATRLTGRPVALPLSVLLGGIGDFRAQLYAAFHSGRSKPHGRQAMPIARQTLRDLSGVGRVSQRAYERRVGVKAQTNYAVGETAVPHTQEKRAGQQGTALFTLKDTDGQQGQPGQSYLAWQLPNSYDGRQQQRPKGRQRRINRELKDLVMKGMPGNVEEGDDESNTAVSFSQMANWRPRLTAATPTATDIGPLTTCENAHFGPPNAPGVFRKIGVSGKNQGVK
jgi:hypothetical protein